MLVSPLYRISLKPDTESGIAGWQGYNQGYGYGGYGYGGYGQGGYGYGYDYYGGGPNYGNWGGYDQYYNNYGGYGGDGRTYFNITKDSVAQVYSVWIHLIFLLLLFWIWKLTCVVFKVWNKSKRKFV